MFIKRYPWVANSYEYNSSEEVDRLSRLSNVDMILNQRQYFKITLLNWEEEALKDIQGDIVSGNLTKDGSSSARRSCSMACNVSMGEYSIEDMRMDFAINKKVYLEIGIKNDTDLWKDEKILWFPQGVFIISDISISSDVNSTVSISINLKDKICLLDGTVGGKFQVSTDFSSVDDYDDNGNQFNRKVQVYQIIQEAVNHFGNEPLHNIVIDDVPLVIKKVVQWNNSTPCYRVKISNDAVDNYQMFINEEEAREQAAEIDGASVEKIIQGTDIGYIAAPFVYDGNLDVNANSNVTTLLDTLKNWLGNFEYFYDEYGVFHFREIKNYLNNSQGKKILDEILENDYMVDLIPPKYVYTFNDRNNIIGINVNPMYENIKNDYVVHGLKKSSASNASADVFYHLVIDDKPDIDASGHGNILVYSDISIPSMNDRWRLGRPRIVESLPDFGKANVIYGVIGKQEIDLSYKPYNPKEYLNYLATMESYTTLVKEYDEFSTDPLLRELNHILYCFMTRVEKCLGYRQTAVMYKDYEYGYNTIAKNIVKNSMFSYYVRNLYNVVALARPKDSGLEAIRTALINKGGYSSGMLPGGNPMDKLNESDAISAINIYINILNLLKNNYPNINIDSIIKDISTTALSTWNNIGIYRNAGSDDLPQINKTIEYNGAKFYYYDGQAWKDASWAYYFDTDGGRTFVNCDFDYRLLEKSGTVSNCMNDAEFYYKKSNDIISNINSADIDFKEWYSINGASYEDNASKYNLYDNITNTYIANDWRTEIILQGVEAEEMATDKPYYYEELASLWHSTYDLAKQEFRHEEISKIYNDYDNDDSLFYLVGNYYFDMIDSSNRYYGEYSVSNIGRRTHVTIDNDINCLFAPQIPDISYIYSSNKPNELDVSEQRTFAMENSLAVCQIGEEIYSKLAIGGRAVDAWTQIKYDLLMHTNYQENISISGVPAFYLEPNFRVLVNDASTNTFGDYNMENISYSFGPGNAMSITCKKTVEKM